MECECGDCGLVFTVPTPANGHIEATDAAVEPTCTKTGLTAGKHCSICGAVTVAQTTLPTTSHPYGDDGMCTACGVLKPQEDVEIPDYVTEAALELVEKIQAVKKSDSIVFIAASDAHQTSAQQNIVDGNTHAGMAMHILRENIGDMDFACYLGDYTWGSSTTTLDDGLSDIRAVNSYIDAAFYGIPQFRTSGNHDSLKYSESQNGSSLTTDELFPLFGAYNEGMVYGSETEGYGYRDIAAKKLRVICLNTAENGQKEYVSDTQKLWFAETLRQTGQMEGWSILILSHHPLDWGDICTTSNVLKAYVDGSNVTIGGVKVDFADSNGAAVLANVHGHIHCFTAENLNSVANSVGTPYDVLRVATPNMCFYRNNEYGQNGRPEYFGIEYGETETYNKTAGTANDTAFVVNVINPSDGTFYSFCYGAGYDRVLELSGNAE